MFINFFMEGRVELTLKDGPCFNGGGSEHLISVLPLGSHRNKLNLMSHTLSRRKVQF